MSYKDSINSDENPLSNSEIKSILLNIYDRLTKPSTKDVGYELFLKLIHKHLYNSPSISFIISQLAEFIPPLPPKEKEPTLSLLSLIFFDPTSDPQNPKKKTIYFQYLSPVLSIIQSITNDKNSSIYGSIANTYAEIVQNLMPTDINYALEDLDMEERKGYELLQGFCVYNMKQEEKANRVIGSLCLTKLVENCPVVLQEKYMKFIWDNIITFIEMKNYTAKYELLNCLISLILGAENLFIPYANATLYKVLDFLSEDDSNKRKLALNVIYTLIYYCKEEILPLKEHIISFLKVLKTDKVKEVREVCLLILQIFNENEPKKKEKQKSIGGIINTKKGNFEKKDSGEIEKNNKNKNRPKTGNKMKKNNKFFENNKKFEKNPFKDNSFDNVNNTNYNKKNSNNININNNTNNNDEGEINIKVISTQNKFNKDTSNNTIATGHVSSLSSTQNKSKSKKSNNFVNEKMIIKPDPNKSIFKAVPNPGFFNQANQKNNDIVIMPKKKPKQIISNNNNMNINNKLSNNDTYHNNNEKNKIEKKKDMNSNYQKEIKTKEKEDLRYTKMFENEEEDMHIKETEEENNVIRNNKNNIIDYDESINEKENKYEIEAVDKNIIQKLLNQMEFLTKGQSSLEKMFNNIQMDTQDQIESMNINYDKLLSKTNKLHQEFDNYHLNGY
jgi:hypothetical protein